MSETQNTPAESNEKNLDSLAAQLFGSVEKDGMTVTAFICNHAENSNGLLYASGAGVNKITIAPNSKGPWIANLAIGAIIDVPWSHTNKEHKIEISLVDEDSQTIFLPVGDGSVQPFHAEATFNVGRPPVLTAGTVQNVAVGFNFHGIPLPRLGVYVFSIEIDRAEYKKLVFTVGE